MKGSDRTTQHTKVVDEIRLALGLVVDLVLFPNPVKRVQVVTGDGRLVWMQAGLAKGSADLIGCLAGRFIGLEVKTGSATSEPHQELWAALIRSKGGFVAEVHSVAEAISAIDRARTGASS